jgi:hypothetical protein
MNRLARSDHLHRLALPPLLTFALLALGGCAASPPPEFVSKAHKFKVQFGSEPKVTEAGGATKSTIYAIESQAGALTVTITDLPIPDDDPPERIPLYLTSAKRDLIRAAMGTETSEKAISLAGKYPGREFTASFTHPQPGVLRARIYLVGKRLYQVMAIGSEEFVSAPAAGAFLESFMVLE